MTVLPLARPCVRPTSRWRWCLVLPIGIGLLVGACGSSPAGLNDSEAGPSPVVLKDTSPGQLTVSVGVNMGGYDANARDRTLIDVNFLHDSRPVRFIAGEQLKCNDVPLKSFTGSFEIEFATMLIAGKAMTCVYRSGSQTASLTFDIPPALVILSPTDHEKVRHGPRTTVRYSGAMKSDLWVVALSPNAKAVAETNEITTTMATLDTSALGTGDGSIALTDPSNFALTDIQGHQFRSVQGTARRMTMVAVAWI